jgi:hypothetical protein
MIANAPERLRHARGVIDTSTVILLPRIEDATLLPGETPITALTLAELTVGPLVAVSRHWHIGNSACFSRAASVVGVAHCETN